MYVDIPTDVLDAEVSTTPAPAEPQRMVPDSGQVDRAAAAIEEARRVVIWAGGGVVQADASAELADLAARLGAAVVTTFAGRGVLPPDSPWLVGLPPHEPEVAAYVGSADLLLAVGTTFDGPMTRNWSMPWPPALVAVNVHEADLTTNVQPDVAVLGDARLVLAELTRRTRPRETDDAELRAMRTAAWARLRDESTARPALDLLEAVDAATDAHDPTVVVDMTIPGYWYGGYARVAGPRRLQYPIGWGTLGYALPAAIGAAASRERPVLAICGDGGFMYAVGELATLRQERLPVTVLVVDDGGYGMLRFDQDRAGDEHHGVDLVRPDFGALATAFGIPVTTLDDMDGLEAALTDGLASRKPRMVVLDLALTPPRTTSPRWHD